MSTSPNLTNQLNTIVNDLDADVKTFFKNVNTLTDDAQNFFTNAKIAMWMSVGILIIFLLLLGANLFKR
jgi:hypothetical protein